MYKCNYVIDITSNTLCDFTFEDLTSLKKHLLDIHGISPKIYKCITPGCSFESTNNAAFLKHKTHCKEENFSHYNPSTKLYHCDYSNCSFSTNRHSSFTKHVNQVHLKIKPKFNCLYCVASLASNDSLKNHIKNTHTCEFCSERFDNLQQKRLHTKKIHSDKDKTKHKIINPSETKETESSEDKDILNFLDYISVSNRNPSSTTDDFSYNFNEDIPIISNEEEEKLLDGQIASLKRSLKKLTIKKIKKHSKRRSKKRSKRSCKTHLRTYSKKRSKRSGKTRLRTHSKKRSKRN